MTCTVGDEPVRPRRRRVTGVSLAVAPTDATTQTATVIAEPTPSASRCVRFARSWTTSANIGSLYRLASSWRSASGLTGITDLPVEQVHSFRVEFGGEHSGSDEVETTGDIHIASGMEGVCACAVEGALGSNHARTAELLFSLLPEWMRRLPGWLAESHSPWMGSTGLAGSPWRQRPGGCPWWRRNAAAKAFGDA